MSKELIDQLAEFRTDPAIREVLLEHKAAVAASSPVPKFGDLDPEGEDQYDQHATGPLPFQGSPDGSHGFLRDRNDARKDLGTSNWLQHHRDELSQSEKKRVENRLRAENMFAVAQMEYEQLVADLHKPPPEPEPTPAEPTPSKKDTTSGGSKPKESTPRGETKTKYQFEPKAAIIPGSNGTDQSHHQQSSPPSRGPIPGYALDHGNSPAGIPAAARVTLDPTKPLETPDGKQESEEELYNRKQKELAALMQSGEVKASPPRASQDVTLQAGGGSSFVSAQPTSPAVAADLKSVYDSPSGAAAAGGHIPVHLPFRATMEQQRFDHDFATLVEAIHQRDRTIERLERLMREDKEYYENQLIQKTAEIENMKSSCDSRIQAMKTEMTHILQTTRRTAELDQHDIKGKLSSIEHSYERGLAELRTEFGTFLSSYQADCDKKMRDITTSAESSIRTARDAYTVDQAKALDKERKSLVDRIQKEQDYMLKDAEIELRTEIDKVLFNKVRSQVEASVRQQLRSELLPIVKRELLESMRTQVISGARDDVSKYVKAQLDQLSMQQRQFHIEKQQWMASTRIPPINVDASPSAAGRAASEYEGESETGLDLSNNNSQLNHLSIPKPAPTSRKSKASEELRQQQQEQAQQEQAQQTIQATHEAKLAEGAEQIKELEAMLAKSNP